ncbi:MAG: gluconate 2-dehydrogenase subunit 3 family protein [Bryobacteraceae bacterium]
MAEHQDRRHFLKYMATGGTVALTSWPALANGALPEPLAPGCKVFSVSRATLVGAIADRIVPADDYPGGKAAGVVSYIDGILAGPFGRSYAARYEQGLTAINEVSQTRFGSDFVSLDSGQQASILAALESDKEVSTTAHEFFGLILQHTFEGYYGDPEHGGNLNAASWKMIGFGG